MGYSRQSIAEHTEITWTDDGGAVMPIEVRVSPSGIVKVNGRPVLDRRSEGATWAGSAVLVLAHLHYLAEELGRRQEAAAG